MVATGVPAVKYPRSRPARAIAWHPNRIASPSEPERSRNEGTTIAAPRRDHQPDPPKELVFASLSITAGKADEEERQC
jgi:hypothetical protein